MAVIPNPTVPYIGQLHGVSPGLMLNISGQPSPTAKWFAINMQCGPNMNPRDDIALHINPRFDGNMSKVIRNSLQGQQWGMEESYGHFPFAPGQPFEVLILVEQDEFKLAINGEHYTDFRQRMPSGRINTLSIDGDVQLFSIRFEGGNAGIPAEVQQSTTSQLGAMPMPGRSPSPQPHGGMPMPGGGMPMPMPGGGGGGMPMPPGGGGVLMPAGGMAQAQHTGGYAGAPGAHGAMPMQQQHVGQPAGGAYGTGFQGGPTQPYETQQYMPQSMPMAMPVGGYGYQEPKGASGGYAGTSGQYMTGGIPSSGQGQQGLYGAPVHGQDEGLFSRGKGSHGSSSGGHSTAKQALKYGAVGLGGALAGAALTRLVYPGHKKGYKHGGHGGMMGGMGHMMGGHGFHGGKHKKMKKFKHKGGKHKGWKHKHSSSSSSSSE